MSDIISLSEDEPIKRGGRLRRPVESDDEEVSGLNITISSNLIILSDDNEEKKTKKPK